MSDSDFGKKPFVISPTIMRLVADNTSPIGARLPEPYPEGHQTPESGAPTELSSDAVGFDTNDVTIFVSQCIEAWNIEPLFDGTLLPKGALLRAETANMVPAYLATEQLTERDLADQIVLFALNGGYDWKKQHIETALRQLLRRMQKARFNTVIMPLVSVADEKLNDAMCQSEWDRLSSLFEMPSDLAVAVVKHFIWQVKQKVLGRPVVHHLMAIIYSALQGSGKSTFVRMLIWPLRELASADALLSDFADRRSGEIYRFPVAVIDDMEQITKASVPILKNLITSERINRRKLHTSKSVSTRQSTTLIGTANAPVHELVEDETGHRRFVMLPFRNGDVSKGGDPAVWETVSSLNYEMLWHSVDAFTASPIKSHLRDLAIYQNQGRPVPPLLKWLRDLQVGTELAKAITVRAGVRADGLHDLYTIQTGNQISRPRFAEEMLLYMGDERVPFSGKQKVEVGVVYRLKGELRSSQSAPAVPSTGTWGRLSAVRDLTKPSEPSKQSGPSGPPGSPGSSVPSGGIDGAATENEDEI